MNHRVLLCILLLFAAARPGLVRAQLSGTVHDSEGTPVGGATVEIWSSTERIGQRTTGSDGGFAFAEAEVRLSSGLLVRSIGFRPIRVPLQRGGQMRLQLDRKHILLDDIVVSSDRGPCQWPDDPAARRLWQASSGKYSPTRDMAVAASARVWEGRVAADELGYADTTALGWGARGRAPRAHSTWLQFLDQYGYAWPSSGYRLGSVYDRWRYPPLESEFATHFVEDEFAANQKFAFSADGSTIRFCPRRGMSKATIRGELHLAHDSSIARADWRFQGRRLGEEAGGFAIFAPTAETGQRFLLPITGAVWRRVDVGTYTQRWYDYKRWLLGPPEALHSLMNTLAHD